MDNLDKHILAELESDGRQSFSQLGDKVGLSKTPCWNRVKAMQKQGKITQFAAVLSPESLGLNIHALVHAVVDFSQYQAFEAAIIQHPSVRACHAVTGDFDYVLEIHAKDIDDFDTLLRADLSTLPGVQRFKTSISTRMVKANGPYTQML
ncbi:Lrp/AsnC family transcriptional regulator [Aestuariibacter sp. AA17]|uniref:Lrp/AsnC family transcriptional regulator n=1 Tax=Fluctibacter corallii TaxID=2984329 RepID=A0ABT3ABZ5_9ALTE|nr:Lrp/AsnC family transcriptional regulator [Aestuariibacter sp. AA17]MCV2886208.1 Lrp/AsnC family transcriptional regulator [Aestuariibacter sp. AA17]